MISDAELELVLSELSVREVAGSFFRVVSQKRSHEIESISASLLRGGRFNPPLIFGALYLGESKEVCINEVLFHVGGDRDALKPLSIGAFQVHLTRVLDLTNPKIAAALIKALKIKEEELRRPGYHVLTQRIGKAARSLGIEGILFHFAVSIGNKNLAIFVDTLSKKSTVVKTSVKPLS